MSLCYVFPQIRLFFNQFSVCSPFCSCVSLILLIVLPLLCNSITEHLLIQHYLSCFLAQSKSNIFIHIFHLTLRFFLLFYSSETQMSFCETLRPFHSVCLRQILGVVCYYVYFSFWTDAVNMNDSNLTSIMFTSLNAPRFWNDDFVACSFIERILLSWFCYLQIFELHVYSILFILFRRGMFYLDIRNESLSGVISSA